jgi:hypothetical protein
VSAHALQVGPSVIHYLCCGGTTVTDNEMIRAAFDGIDNPVAMLDVWPVTID